MRPYRWRVAKCWNPTDIPWLVFHTSDGSATFKFRTHAEAINFAQRCAVREQRIIASFNSAAAT